ncbi:MAG: pirin family protein [Acidobacteria bacterium]|nr:pirin family protein [Acidobacteriota bacterium]
MIKVRKSTERGHLNFGWLDTYHTFSFGEYYDPRHMGFRSLRVINEDFVSPGRGFPEHGHGDMEIVTYILAGALEHRDSMGNGSVIRPGDVQRMSAGTGVRHSEKNPSAGESVHLLQIWILPSEQGIDPGYEQKNFAEDERRGRLRLVASPDGREGSVTIRQDASIYATLLDAGWSVEHALAPGRHAWAQVARGAVEINGQSLGRGDGAAASEEERLVITATEPAELLLFDLN